MVLLDAMEKSAAVSILQAELNDRPGVILKLTGGLGDVRAATAAAEALAARMGVEIIADVIAAPHPGARPVFEAPADFNPLFSQSTVNLPRQENPMQNQAPFAVGLIETQGFTAVFEALDTALKTAAVELVAKEKLGGGYITVVIKGDVAAVRAAVDAAAARVDGLGKLIATHVIPSPSAGVLEILPKL